MPGKMIFALLAVVIGSLFIGSFFVVTDKENKATSVNYFGFNATSQSTNSSLGLALELSINSTHIVQDQTIFINVTEYNILTTINNVTATSHLPPDAYFGPCPSSSPVGFEIFQGYYTVGNLSTATSLRLYKPGTYNCPAFFSYRYFVFQPLSDNNSAFAMYYANSTGPEQCCKAWQNDLTQGFDAKYYWDSSGEELTFSPGIYTIMASDEWGQQDLLHFAVLS